MTAPRIKDDLQAFLDHCRTHDIAHRPFIWARHYDIWNEPVGEIGFPDNGHPRVSMYAALAPLALVPELRSAVLVVDGTTLEYRYLSVVSVTITKDGPEVLHWMAPYEMSDTGKMTIAVGHPEPELEDDIILDVVGQLVESRRQAIWVKGWGFDDTLEVIADMVAKIVNT